MTRVSLLVCSTALALAGWTATAAAQAKTHTVKGTIKLPANTPAGSAFVYLKGEGLSRTAPKQPLLVRQKNKQFGPRVLVVVKGTTVEFPNDDRIMHNVYSRSSGNAFDLGHYKKGESKSVTFNKPGVVDIYCNIHPNMAATVLVVENDHVAPVAADGSFSLAGVPVGKYEVVAWMPASTPVTAKVEVKDSGSSAVKLELSAPKRSTEHTNKDGLPYGRYK